MNVDRRVLMEQTSGEITKLEENLGIRFHDQKLAWLALVHSSYANERPDIAPDSNQRLEFLGDAFLDLVIAAELFQRLPGMTEGGLTMARSALVRGESLAEMAQELGLGGLLLLGQGEEASGGRQRTSNLAAAFEALMGAIYLDQGYAAARELALRLFEPRIEALPSTGPPRDAKSRLQELIQRQGKSPLAYRIVDESGPEHARLFVAEALVAGQVLGRGSGRRKAEAEEEAAKAALSRLLEQETSEAPVLEPQGGLASL